MDTQDSGNNERSFFFYTKWGHVNMATIEGGHTIVESSEAETKLATQVKEAYQAFLTELQSRSYSGPVYGVKDIVQQEMDKSAYANVPWDFAANEGEMQSTLASRKPQTDQTKGSGRGPTPRKQYYENREEHDWSGEGNHWQY